MVRVRLWTTWTGDGVLYDPGQVVLLDQAEALRVCYFGAGEIVGPELEVASVAPSRTAVAVKPGKRRKAARR